MMTQSDESFAIISQELICTVNVFFFIWIDTSLWTHSAISHSSQCSTTGVTKVVVCAILYVG